MYTCNYGNTYFSMKDENVKKCIEKENSIRDNASRVKKDRLRVKIKKRKEIKNIPQEDH